MKFVFSSFIILSFFSVASAQESTKSLDSELKSSIEKRIKRKINQSIAIALLDKDGVVYFNFGKTHKNGEEVDEHTIYEIGSITKAFTAILLAKQSLNGDLELGDNINNYLPSDVNVPSLDDEPITFLSLSNHTSGLPRLPGNMLPKDPANPYADYSVDMMYEFISSYTPNREVGSEYEYSNLAQGLLGHLLALNKKSSFEEMVIEDITTPLKMKNTRINLSNKMKEKLALPHSDGKLAKNWDLPTLAGAGALRSSTSDMARFISANLGYLGTSLKPAMELTHYETHDNSGMGIGLGWHLMEGRNGDIIWHNGGTGGYRSFAGFNKEKGTGVVVLTNSDQTVDDIGFRLLRPDYILNIPKSRKDAIEVAEKTLSTYEGTYQLSPNFQISITRKGKELFGQATGQNRFKMYAENDTTFFLTIVEAKITFRVKDDKVESLTLFQGGQAVPGRKIR